MPQRRQNSIVRTPTRSIFGCSIEPSVFSINVHGTPRQPRSPASAKPTGPAPTIKTGVRSDMAWLAGAQKGSSWAEGIGPWTSIVENGVCAAPPHLRVPNAILRLTRAADAAIIGLGHPREFWIGLPSEQAHSSVRLSNTG